MSQKVTMCLIKLGCICVCVSMSTLVVNQGQGRRRALNCCFSSCRWWARTQPGVLHQRKVHEWSRPSYRAGTDEWHEAETLSCFFTVTARAVFLGKVRVKPEVIQKKFRSSFKFYHIKYQGLKDKDKSHYWLTLLFSSLIIWSVK